MYVAFPLMCVLCTGTRSSTNVDARFAREHERKHVLLFCCCSSARLLYINGLNIFTLLPGAISSTVSCSFIEIFATAVKHKIRATIWNSIERAHTRPFGTTHRVAVATNEHHFWSRQLHTNANETRTPKDHPDKTPERPAGLISNAHHATRRPQKITANSNPPVGRVGWSPCYIYHTLT